MVTMDQLLSPQMHTLNTKCLGKHTHNTVNHSYVEVFPHKRSSCFLSKLLEVGIGVKGLQVADQDIVTHFIVNLQQR